MWYMTLRWEVLSAHWSCKVAVSNSLNRQFIDSGWSVIQDNAPSHIEPRPGESEVVQKQRNRQVAGSQRTAVTVAGWVDTWRTAVISAAGGRKQQTLTSADRLTVRPAREKISQRGRK